MLTYHKLINTINSFNCVADLRLVAARRNTYVCLQNLFLSSVFNKEKTITTITTTAFSYGASECLGFLRVGKKATNIDL